MQARGSQSKRSESSSGTLGVQTATLQAEKAIVFAYRCLIFQSKILQILLEALLLMMLQPEMQPLWHYSLVRVHRQQTVSWKSYPSH